MPTLFFFTLKPSHCETSILIILQPFHSLFRYDYSHDYDVVEEICEMILNRTKHRPTIGVICGSGLSALGDIVEEKYDIPYEQIKQFPKSTGKFVMLC